ncbi:alpha/beta-hydrolase [Cylindrobasidium torrendii FP15055 ss-10]|uniref:Alpha/beta-hydrolase n=1 Tax=Cylindrobasidium torrendii FP15055 ss-10 TaxID=1314674 RepID=A0A0D7B6F6_9AGAR|nr:alpha/beta-hydrolase [Cylindrobasidium torrendii FP15055 ss-10]
MERKTVKIPSATPGWNLDAWQYFPTTPATALPPVIIMANGFSCTKKMGLSEFAEAFAEHGYASVVFDYRRWGDSDGMPRCVQDYREQRADYRSVIRWARAQGIYDNNRLVVWGYSYAGGHSIVMAGEEAMDVAAAIAFRPYVGESSNYSTKHLAVMLFHAILDAAKQAVGLSPHYIEVAGRNRFLFGEDSVAALQKLGANGGWENKVTASSLFPMTQNRPVDRAQKIRCPTLLIAAENDKMCIFEGQLQVAAESAKVELVAVRGGHWDANAGCPDFEEQLTMMLKFLEKQVPRILEVYATSTELVTMLAMMPDIALGGLHEFEPHCTREWQIFQSDVQAFMHLMARMPALRVLTISEMFGHYVLRALTEGDGLVPTLANC